MLQLVQQLSADRVICGYTVPWVFPILLDLSRRCNKHLVQLALNNWKSFYYLLHVQAAKCNVLNLAVHVVGITTSPSLNSEHMSISCFKGFYKAPDTLLIIICSIQRRVCDYSMESYCPFYGVWEGQTNLGIGPSMPLRTMQYKSLSPVVSYKDKIDFEVDPHLLPCLSNPGTVRLGARRLKGCIDRIERKGEESAQKKREKPVSSGNPHGNHQLV